MASSALDRLVPAASSRFPFICWVVVSLARNASITLSKPKVPQAQKLHAFQKRLTQILLKPMLCLQSGRRWRHQYASF